MLNLPSLSISYQSDKVPKLDLSIENCTIRSKVFDNERVTLIVLGTPVLGEKIVYDEIWAAASNSGLAPEFLKKVNGEFLLVMLDKTQRILQISNDRFTSIPLFYVADKTGFFASIFYKDVWEHLKSTNRVKLNEYGVFEFLWLQRLIGKKTYDQYSSFMLAATTLTYSDGAATTSRYWTPSFEKTKEPKLDCSNHLVELLRQSTRRKTSDDPRQAGMFLSGGIDSRTVLGSFEQPPISFTIGVSDNNEVKIARKIATNVGSPHRFIQIDADPYSRYLDEMVMLGGGMHAFDHGIFYGLKQKVSTEVDVLFHGHGIDYMFQGMYLLTRNLNLFGRKTSFKLSEDIGNDFVDTYLNRIGHRLKDLNVIDYVLSRRRSEMFERLRQSVKEIQLLGEGFCRTADDQWEYMLIHALSRHYPFTNLTSMGTAAEQRVIAFDNDIFDLYLSLPKSHRLDGRIAKQALKIIDSDLAAIPTANNNQSPNQSALKKDSLRVLRLLKRKAGIERGHQILATPEERTWPDRGMMFANQPRLNEAATALQNSEALSSLGILDMDRLNRDIPTWLESPGIGSGAFLTFLVTIDRFIKFNA